MSTLNVATVKSLNTLPPAVQNSSGTEIGTFCRAWVNFNGTGTVAIRASFNVSSITDNATGEYTVNFTTAMSDANYAISLCTAHGGVSANMVSPVNTARGAPFAAGFYVYSLNASFGVQDAAYIFAAVFR